MKRKAGVFADGHGKDQVAAITQTGAHTHTHRPLFCTGYTQTHGMSMV